jgi:hypothetical protein
LSDRILSPSSTRSSARPDGIAKTTDARAALFPAMEACPGSTPFQDI